MANAQPSKASSSSKWQISGQQKCNVDFDALLHGNCIPTTRIHECLSDARLQPEVVLRRIDPRTNSHISSLPLVPSVVSKPAPCVDYVDSSSSSSWQTAEHTSSATAAAAINSFTSDPRQSRRVNSSRKQRTRLSKDYVVDIEDGSASSMSDVELEQPDDQPWCEDVVYTQRKKKSRLSSCDSTVSSADSPSRTSSPFRGTPKAFRGRGRGARRGRGASRGGRGGRGSRGGCRYRAAASSAGPALPMEEASAAEDVSSSVSISADLCRNATAEHSTAGVEFGCVYPEGATSDVVQTTLTIQSSASVDKSQNDNCATETEIGRLSSENSSSGAPVTALTTQTSSAADNQLNNYRAMEVDASCITFKETTSDAVLTTLMKPLPTAVDKMSSDRTVIEKLSKNRRASEIDMDGASSNDGTLVPVLGTLTGHPPAAVNKPTNDAMDSCRTSTMDQHGNSAVTDMIVEEVSCQTDNVGAREEPEPSKAQGRALLQCTKSSSLAPAEEPKLCGKISCVRWCVCCDSAQKTAESQEQLSDDEAGNETDSGHSGDEEGHAARTSGVHACWIPHNKLIPSRSCWDADAQAERNAVVRSELSPFALPLCFTRKMDERMIVVTPSLEISSNDDDEDGDQSVVVVSQSPATARNDSIGVSFASDRRAPQSVQYQPPMGSAPMIVKAPGPRPPVPLRKEASLPEPQPRSLLAPGCMTLGGTGLPPKQPVFVPNLGHTGSLFSTSFSQPDRQQHARGTVRVVLSPPYTARAPVKATLKQSRVAQRFENMAQRSIPVEVKAVEGTSRKILDSLSTYGVFAPIVRGRTQTLEEILDTNDRLEAATAHLGNVPPLNVEGARVSAMMVFSRADGQSESTCRLKSHVQLRIICADSRWESHAEIRQRILSLTVQLADIEPLSVTELNFDDAVLYVYPKNAGKRTTNVPLTVSELAEEPRYMLLIMKRKMIVDQVVLPPPPLPATTFQRQRTVAHRRPMGQYRNPRGPSVPLGDRSTSNASESPVTTAALASPAVKPAPFTVPTSVTLLVARPSISTAPDVGSSTFGVRAVTPREGPPQLHNVASTSGVTVQSSSLQGNLPQVPASSTPTRDSLVNHSMCSVYAKRGRPRAMKSIIAVPFSTSHSAARSATTGKIATPTQTVAQTILGTRTIPGSRTAVRLSSSAGSAETSPAVRWSHGVAPGYDERNEVPANQLLPAERCPPQTVIRLPISRSQSNQSSAVGQMQSPSTVQPPVSSAQVSGVLPFLLKHVDSKSMPQEPCTETSSPSSAEHTTGQVMSIESSSVMEHTPSDSDPVWSAATVSYSSPTNLEVKKTSYGRHAGTTRGVATGLIESARTQPAPDAAFSNCASSESTALPVVSNMLRAKNIDESSSASASQPLSACPSSHRSFENVIKTEPGLIRLPHLYDHPDMVEPGVLMSVDIEEIDANETENGQACHRAVGPAADNNLNSTLSGELTSIAHVSHIATRCVTPLEAMFGNSVGTKHCPIRSSSDPINSDVFTSTVAGRECSEDVSPDVGSLASRIGCSSAFSESANAMPNSEESAAVSACVVTSPALIEQSTIAAHHKPIAQSYLTYDECADFLINPIQLSDANTSAVEVPRQQAASFAASNPSSSDVHESLMDCSFEYSVEASMADAGSEDDKENDVLSMQSSISSQSSFVDVDGFTSPTDTNISSAQRSPATRYLQSNANGHGSADGEEQDAVNNHTSPHRLVSLNRSYESRRQEIYVNSSGIQPGIAAVSTRTAPQTTNAASQDNTRSTGRGKLVGAEAEVRNFRHGQL